VEFVERQHTVEEVAVSEEGDVGRVRGEGDLVPGVVVREVAESDRDHQDVTEPALADDRDLAPRGRHLRDLGVDDVQVLPGILEALRLEEQVVIGVRDLDRHAAPEAVVLELIGERARQYQEAHVGLSLCPPQWAGLSVG
jgi:hypothetical protein